MQQFDLKTQLRSEVEDPFAKVRLFALPAAFAAAGIATYFGGTSLLAEVAGLRPAAPDTFQNLAIDLASLGTIGFFWRREAVAEEKRMKRIAVGAAIASLRVQLLAGTQARKSVKLLELRSGRGDDAFDESARRVVVLCAEEPALAESLAQARAYSERLCDADMLVVPLVASAGSSAVALPRPELISGGEGEGIGHLALAEGLGTWQDVLSEERETALSQDANAAARGFTLILKKNGRVGTRRLGMPDWGMLVGDVAKRAAAGLDTTNI